METFARCGAKAASGGWEIAAAAYDRVGCPSCGSKTEVKPGVVFFDEPAPRYSDLHELAGQLRSEDTAIVIGTSGAVIPADRFFAHSRAYSILVNLEAGTHMNESAFNERLYGRATEVLPTILETIHRRMSIEVVGRC